MMIDRHEQRIDILERDVKVLFNVVNKLIDIVLDASATDSETQPASRHERPIA